MGGYQRIQEGDGYSFKRLSIFSPKSNAGNGRVEKNEGERYTSLQCPCGHSNGNGDS